jgi:hypothetical protein
MVVAKHPSIVWQPKHCKSLSCIEEIKGILVDLWLKNSIRRQHFAW